MLWCQFYKDMETQADRGDKTIRRKKTLKGRYQCSTLDSFGADDIDLKISGGISNR